MIFRRIGRTAATSRFADHPDGDPCLHVQRPHRAMERPNEPVLHLRPGKRFVARRPAHWHQARRSGHRPRIPRAIRQISREYLILVGRDQHVIGRSALRENRHLLLRLDQARVGFAVIPRRLCIRAPARWSHRSVLPSAGTRRATPHRSDAIRTPAPSVSNASTPDTRRAHPPAWRATGRHGSRCSGSRPDAANHRAPAR